MKRSKYVWLAILLLPLVPVVIVRSARGVRPFAGMSAAASPRFAIAESAALFVGIGRFTQDNSLAEVPFAVDDAVDLAYAFTLEPNVNLVLSHRVVVALSGKPRKEESKVRLQALKDAGVTVVMKTDQSDLLKLLETQAGLAGRDGLLIVSFATHGFSRDGVPYLLGSSSLFRHVETNLSAARISDIVGTSDAKRSLIFIDACRERVNVDARSGRNEPSAAPLISAMKDVEGQVIFFGAAAGDFAYDDEKRRNGVFTSAVIDGLRCEADTNRNLVTVDTLSTYVERHVLAWIRTNRDPSVRKATQISTEGSTKFMPLATCGSPPPPSTPITPSPSRADFAESALNVYDDRGNHLWRRTMPGRVRNFAIGDLFQKRTRHVVILSSDKQGTSLVSTYDQAGKLLFTDPYSGSLRDVFIVRRTSRHDPKIIVTGTTRQLAPILRVGGPVPIVLMLDPKRPGTHLWYGAIPLAHGTIERLDLEDRDNDGRLDFALSISDGSRVHVDFDGQLIATEPGARGTVHYSLIAAK